MLLKPVFAIACINCGKLLLSSPIWYSNELSIWLFYIYFFVLWLFLIIVVLSKNGQPQFVLSFFWLLARFEARVLIEMFLWIEKGVFVSSTTSELNRHVLLMPCEKIATTAWFWHHVWSTPSPCLTFSRVLPLSLFGLSLKICYQFVSRMFIFSPSFPRLHIDKQFLTKLFAKDFILSKHSYYPPIWNLGKNVDQEKIMEITSY